MQNHVLYHYSCFLKPKNPAVFNVTVRTFSHLFLYHNNVLHVWLVYHIFTKKWLFMKVELYGFTQHQYIIFTKNGKKLERLLKGVSYFNLQS